MASSQVVGSSLGAAVGIVSAPVAVDEAAGTKSGPAPGSHRAGGPAISPNVAGGLLEAVGLAVVAGSVSRRMSSSSLTPHSLPSGLELHSAQLP